VVVSKISVICIELVQHIVMTGGSSWIRAAEDMLESLNFLITQKGINQRFFVQLILMVSVGQHVNQFG
jgi:hypothetical protein